LAQGAELAGNFEVGGYLLATTRTGGEMGVDQARFVGIEGVEGVGAQ